MLLWGFLGTTAATVEKGRLNLTIPDWQTPRKDLALIIRGGGT